MERSLILECSPEKQAVDEVIFLLCNLCKVEKLIVLAFMTGTVSLISIVFLLSYTS